MSQSLLSPAPLPDEGPPPDSTRSPSQLQGGAWVVGDGRLLRGPHWKVSNCELFFDLVYVVIIHTITEPLELISISVLPFVWVKSILLTCTVWVLWSTVSDFAITSRMFRSKNSQQLHLQDSQQLDGDATFTVFAAMACSAFLGRAAKRQDPLLFVFWYLAAQAICCFSYWRNAHTKESAVLFSGKRMSEEDVEAVKQGSLMYIGLAAVDAVLLLPAAAMLHYEANGDIFANGFSLPWWFWLAQVLVKVVLVFVGNWQVQQGYSTFDAYMQGNEHWLEIWQERFQLVVLISLGEVVASAVVGAGGESQSTGSSSSGDNDNYAGAGASWAAMLTAVGCFLLYFSVDPVGWRRCGVLGALHFSGEALATVFMTCALAGMGAAFGRLLKQEEADAETIPLLYFTTALFLAASSVNVVFGAPGGGEARRESGDQSVLHRSVQVAAHAQDQEAAASISDHVSAFSSSSSAFARALQRRGRGCLRVVAALFFAVAPHLLKVSNSSFLENFATQHANCMALLVGMVVLSLAIVEKKLAKHVEERGAAVEDGGGAREVFPVAGSLGPPL